uniref:Interferon gamma n=1 Tax=Electrophorus electricus TaxID=8005 RepID=A0A4W4GJ89_ELEEL
MKMRILFLGICFLTFEWMANSEAFLPENTKKCIDKLNDHYTKEDDSLYDGHPIFLKNEQKLLMRIILDAYNRIFTQMKNEAQDVSVQNQLNNVKDNLNKMKEHYFPDKNDLNKYAIEVLALKESDPLVQRKALFEVERVYNEAANLAQNHRRRRQTTKSKSNFN